MRRYSNKEIIPAIQNGEDGVLFYLSKRFFHSSRRWLIRNGCSDKDTPAVFSGAVVEICKEVQQKKLTSNIDFDNFFINSLKDYYKSFKVSEKGHSGKSDSHESEVISSCFSILDDSSRQILVARYVQKLNFEQIADRFEYSNPVIAQFEFNKAFSQLEKISRIRLNAG